MQRTHINRMPAIVSIVLIVASLVFAFSPQGAAPAAAAPEAQTGGGNTNRRLARLEATVDAQSTQIAALQTAVFGSASTPVAPTVTSVPGATATSVSTAVPTSMSTSTPIATPTATPDAHPSLDLTPPCEGQRLPCENGERVPLWVAQFELARGRSGNIYMGGHNTSAAEMTTKAFAAKGYSLVDTKSCITGFAIAHGAAVGMERATRFHSMQLWVKDCSGGISYFAFHNDYGIPALYPAGDRVPRNIFDEVHSQQPSQAIVRLESGPGPFCEQWYSNTGQNWAKPDVSLTLCDGAEHFDPAEFTYKAGDYNPANFTGGKGGDRQIEVIWPFDRFPDTGTHVLDQFGRDTCTPSTTTIPYDGLNVPAQCVTWIVQQTLINDLASKAPEFGIRRLTMRNPVRFYDTTGVQAPN